MVQFDQNHLRKQINGYKRPVATTRLSVSLECFTLNAHSKFKFIFIASNICFNYLTRVEFSRMSDPCIRKRTSPAPVFAPRSVGEEVNSLVEEIIKDVAEDISHINHENVTDVHKESTTDLPLAGKRSIIGDIESSTKKQKVCEKESEINELAPSNESHLKGLDREKVNIESEGEGKSCFLSMDLTVSDDEEDVKINTDVPPTSTEDGNPLTVSDADELNSKVNGDMVVKHDKKQQRKPPLSRSVVSPTPSETEEIERENKHQRKIIEIAPPDFEDGKPRCKEELKRGDNKGKYCGKVLNKNGLCPIHKYKNEETKALKTKKIEELETNNCALKKKIEQLDSAFLHQTTKNRELQEKVSKMEQEITKLKTNNQSAKIRLLEEAVQKLNQSFRDVKTGYQELSNKIESVMDDKNKSPSEVATKVSMAKRKITKLDRSVKYRLVEVMEEEAILENENEMFKMYIPKQLGQPDPKKKWSLTFNNESQKFEWSED